MKTKKVNMLFLGDRGIASRALDVFIEKYESKFFQLKGIVSSPSFFEARQSKINSSVRFIPNNDRNIEAILKLIQEGEVNFLLSIQHNWILSKEILRAVKGNAFNLHNAKLPNYKGFNSISHAINNGDELYVSTLHWMDQLVDSGDIIFEEFTSILEIDTAESLHLKTIEASVKAVDRFFYYIVNNIDLPRKKVNNPETGVFYPKDSLNSILELNLKEDMQVINRRVRAAYYPPYNNAYVIINGLKVDLIPVSKEKKNENKN